MKNYPLVWPPVNCSQCKGRLVISESDRKEYEMAKCKDCGHKIYAFTKWIGVIKGCGAMPDNIINEYRKGTQDARSKWDIVSLLFPGVMADRSLKMADRALIEAAKAVLITLKRSGESRSRDTLFIVQAGLEAVNRVRKNRLTRR